MVALAEVGLLHCIPVRLTGLANVSDMYVAESYRLCSVQQTVTLAHGVNRYASPLVAHSGITKFEQHIKGLDGATLGPRLGRYHTVTGAISLVTSNTRLHTMRDSVHSHLISRGGRACNKPNVTRHEKFQD
jgi:hypothetical protein